MYPPPAGHPESGVADTSTPLASLFHYSQRRVQKESAHFVGDISQQKHGYFTSYI